MRTLILLRMVDFYGLAKNPSSSIAGDNYFTSFASNYVELNSLTSIIPIFSIFLCFRNLNSATTVPRLSFDSREKSARKIFLIHPVAVLLMLHASRARVQHSVVRMLRLRV